MIAQLKRKRGFWISRVGEVVLAQAFVTLAFLAQVFAARGISTQQTTPAQPSSQSNGPLKQAGYPLSHSSSPSSASQEAL